MRKNSSTNVNPEAGIASDPSTATPPTKERTKAAPKSGRKVAAKKKTEAKAAIKKTVARKRTTPVKSQGPSDADIRLRAYFIAERRVQLALQGDPSRDWLEARRQLLEEANLNRKG